MATFQVKDFASISASLINLMQSTTQKVTDFNIGAVVRTMLEAIAAEMDELYQQMLNGLLQAIPVAVYNSFSFPALTAQPASGLVTVAITSQSASTLISAGSVFTSNTTSNTYTTAADYTMAAGQTSASLQIVATEAGSASNLGADTQFTISPAPTGFVSATNPNAFINGTDNETPAEQLVRFNGFISTLQRGTADAIQYGAGTANLTDANGNIIEQVASALVVEPYLTNSALPVSSFNCYIFNGVGSTSAALVSQAQNVVNGYTNAAGVRIPGWKGAGTTCTVLACTEQPMNLMGAINVASGYSQATLNAQAEAVISAYLLALPVGATAIFALLESLVMAIPGVTNFIVNSPRLDVPAANVFNKIMPGTIQVAPVAIGALTEASDTVAASGSAT
jgi:uncharacterized phage protein gp47/JayE